MTMPKYAITKTKIAHIISESDNNDWYGYSCPRA